MPVTSKMQHLAKYRRVFLLLYFVLTFLIALLGYMLVPMVLSKYSNAMNYFILLSVYGFFVCVYLVYTNYLF